MAEVTIHGMPQSTYVRTCCMACEEQGIPYERRDALPHSPEILRYSPTGKMPGFRHRDLVLWETSSICRYLDEALGGQTLQPADAVGRARMNCWISMINDWVYQTMVRDIVLPRFGILPADDAKRMAAVERLDRQLALADRTLRESAYLAGDRLSLADLFLAPILFWLGKTPEGEAALPKYAAVGRWYQAIAARPSFQATMPPPLPGQSAA
jgi:glutathione S-transferase